MKVFPSIAYRKVIASVLIALFIFVHAEKAFHTHQTRAGHTQQKGIAVKLISANCIICDFKLSKDSELPGLISKDLPFLFLLKEYAISFTFYHYLPATQIANRGPPFS